MAFIQGARRTAIITLVVAVTLTSCTNPFTESADTETPEEFVESFEFGTVRVGVNDEPDSDSSISSKAVQPTTALDDTVRTITITLDRTDAAGPTVDPAVISLDGDGSVPTVTFEEVATGTWSVTATARDANGNVIMEGTRNGLAVTGSSTIEVSLILFRIGAPAPAPEEQQDPAPSHWEQQAAAGNVILEPDGSVIFLPGGYDHETGEHHITVDSATGALSHAGGGERRSFLATGNVGDVRLSITDARTSDDGGGWGIAFHGAYSETGAYGEFNGYTLQFDQGLGDRIVIRQWVDGSSRGREQSPFVNVAADDYEIDLAAPMDIDLILESGGLVLDVTQAGTTSRVFDIPDIAGRSTDSARARTSGFLGIRSWSETSVDIARMAVTFLTD